MPGFIVDNVAIIDFILINVALGLSIYITLTTGLLTLANAGFMAIGAYTVAIVMTQARLPLAVGFIFAVLLGIAVAVPFGLIVLRLRDLYLAIATLGFGEIVRLMALNGDKLLGALPGMQSKVVFNGGEGITLPYTSPTLMLGLPEMTWVVLGYVLATVYILATLHRSRYGRVLAAIRLDEAAAATLGVDVVRYKLLAFALGAGIAAGSGALAAPIVRVVDPSSYTFSRAVDILAFAVLGGMTHWVGPIVGAAVLTALPEALRFLKDQREVVNGVIMMLAIIYLPRGLADPRFWSGVWRARRGPVAAGTTWEITPHASPRSSDEAPSGASIAGPGAAQPLLEIRDLTCYYGGVAAVDRVSFRVAAGTICGLIGPNGAGKTTLINAVSGLAPISQGTILLDGRSLGGLAPHQVARLGVARSFQNIRLFGDLTVVENVMVGSRRQRAAGLSATLLHLPSSTKDEQTRRVAALALLRRVGLEHLAGVEAGALSYGDQRRVEIARALAADPRILLLDEPAAGMNEVETRQLADLLLELRDQGLTLLVIEHDMGLIMRVSDDVVVLSFGRKIAEGPPDLIRADPEVIRAYLGEEDT
jgi:branched-chain amino acid transport system permease protein